jgi:hypothetical protein
MFSTENKIFINDYLLVYSNLLNLKHSFVRTEDLKADSEYLDMANLCLKRKIDSMARHRFKIMFSD